MDTANMVMLEKINTAIGYLSVIYNTDLLKDNEKCGVDFAEGLLTFVNKFPNRGYINKILTINGLKAAYFVFALSSASSVAGGGTAFDIVNFDKDCLFLYSVNLGTPPSLASAISVKTSTGVSGGICGSNVGSCFGIAAGKTVYIYARDATSDTKYANGYIFVLPLAPIQL